MLEPSNGAAEEVNRLRSVNNDIEQQIKELRDTQLRNSETIGNLSMVAQWSSAGEPIDPGVDLTPEPEPEEEISTPGDNIVDEVTDNA